MNGFNKVILAGNLTRDPEMRYTPSGTAICKFGLALNRKWKDQSGQQKEECTFVDVDAFGKQAETIGQYLKKGNPLLMEGRLKTDSWEKDGKKFSKLTVALESFTFLDSGSRDQQSAPAARPPTGVPTGAEKSKPTEEDDVPF